MLDVWRINAVARDVLSNLVINYKTSQDISQKHSLSKRLQSISIPHCVTIMPGSELSQIHLLASQRSNLKRIP